MQQKVEQTRNAGNFQIHQKLLTQRETVRNLFNIERKNENKWKNRADKTT